MDPHEEAAQHGQAYPLSPAYATDPMELDEHVPLYVPEHPEHHDSSEENIPVEDQPDAEDADSHGFLADSDSMEDDTDAGSIDYPDEDNVEDPEEDPSEEHESEDGPFEDSDETEPFEEDETDAIPPSPRRRGARITVGPQPPMASSTQALIDAFATGSPLSPPPINPTYDQAPLGHRAAMIRMKDDIPEEDMPPRERFVLTAPSSSCYIAESSAAAAARASRDRAEDARKRESEDFYTQLLDAQTDRGDIRLEIDVVRGQRTAYETNLQERAKDDAVRQIMRTHVLEARARINTVEDTGSSC
ncbi:hypothetical protein Tco_0185074 [Tanacetum coccineum]